LVFFLTFSLSATAANESGVVSVDSQLRAEPSADAQAVAEAPADTKLTILQRKGAWYEVKLESPASGQGWIRSFDVQQSANVGWLARFKRVIAGNTAVEGGAQSTIGIRGLGPGDVKKAAPNFQEMAKLQGFQSNGGKAKQYAAGASLKAQKVDYLSQSEKQH
jgi:hypothetical protein